MDIIPNLFNRFKIILPIKLTIAIFWMINAKIFKLRKRLIYLINWHLKSWFIK